MLRLLNQFLKPRPMALPCSTSSNQAPLSDKEKRSMLQDILQEETNELEVLTRKMNSEARSGDKPELRMSKETKREALALVLKSIAPLIKKIIMESKEKSKIEKEKIEAHKGTEETENK